MECQRITFPGGGGFICGSRRRTRPCSACGKPASIACDWKLAGRQAGHTCDRDLCESCARQVGPDKHLCPPHAKLWDEHPKNPGRSPAVPP